MSKNLFAAGFIAFIFLFMIPLRSAAVMEGISTDELTRASDAIVDGEVIDSRSFWSSDGRTIITRAVVAIGEVVRGRVTGKRIVVEYEGGEVGDTGLRVSDMAVLEKGERVLLFLTEGKSRLSGRAYRIVGKGQGKYTIGKDDIARKRGFSVMRGRELIDNDIPVDLLKEKIRGVK